MTPKFWIKQVAGTRDDGTASTVDFQPGLNTVIGPSNTGKTRIFKTIGWVFGDNESLPFTRKTGYTRAHVTIVTPEGEVTFHRDSERGKPIEVESTDPRIESATYHLSRKSKRPINNVMMTLLGIDPSRQVIKNEAFQKQPLTWDSLDHIILVNERQIDREEPSMLMPRNLSVFSKTAALSTLLVLIQDANLDEFEDHETSAQRSARRRAVERFIYSKLDQLETRIQQAQQILEQAAQQGHTLDAFAAKLRSDLNEIMSARERVLAKDALVTQQLNEVDQQLPELEVRAAQRGKLVTQYQADLDRLEFQLKAAALHVAESDEHTCAFCGNHYNADIDDHVDTTALSQAHERIAQLAQGAHRNQEQLHQVLGELRNRRANLQQQRASLHDQLTQQIEPARFQLEQTLSNLKAAQEAQVLHEQLLEQRNSLEADLDEMETPAEVTEKFKPLDLFEPNFFYSMRKIMTDILRTAHFVGADRVSFDKETVDIEVAGYPKKDEQGKGYSAYFNTVLMLAFHKYLRERRSPHYPGVLVIDSPLKGFDQGRAEAAESMREGLFTYLTQEAAHQQIIILENTDKVPGVDRSLMGNLIEFTKNTKNGRYGYLKDVIDVAEEEDSE
ncbi:AAA family ATPase [Trueperella pecoris]|uniref:Nuclease SbcCD subunit C n=1 Tax=Trueperella pecoris TaxID=2733571 RepID=A0A7M1QVA3_9ACTO|nr:AAA family ATPase [Trueperella pecoris]QOR45980.1 AAA family ATPase [Trueperella pecoris]